MEDSRTFQNQLMSVVRLLRQTHVTIASMRTFTFREIFLVATQVCVRRPVVNFRLRPYLHIPFTNQNMFIEKVNISEDFVTAAFCIQAHSFCCIDGLRQLRKFSVGNIS